MVRQAVFQIETLQVTTILLLHLLDMEVREQHAAFIVVVVRQGIEPRRPQIPGLDLLRCHRGQIVPARALGQLDAHPALHRLFPGVAGDALDRPVGKVVTLFEQVGEALLDLRPGLDHALLDALEGFPVVDRRIAVRHRHRRRNRPHRTHRRRSDHHRSQSHLESPCLRVRRC